MDQWEYQLILQLLTGEVRPGAWQAQVVVPFTTATDTGELELAEIPGYGPILPSTARQLLEDAEWTQVAVDSGRRGDRRRRPHPRRRPLAHSAKPAAAKSRMRENWELSLAQLMSTPPKQRLMPEQLAPPPTRPPRG